MDLNITVAYLASTLGHYAATREGTDFITNKLIPVAGYVEAGYQALSNSGLMDDAHCDWYTDIVYSLGSALWDMSPSKITPDTLYLLRSQIVNALNGWMDDCPKSDIDETLRRCWAVFDEQEQRHETIEPTTAGTDVAEAAMRVELDRVGLGHILRDKSAGQIENILKVRQRNGMAGLDNLIGLANRAGFCKDWI